MSIALLSQGKIPDIRVIEETIDLDEREQYFIKYFKDKNLNLLNMTNGGKETDYLHRAKKNYPWANTHSPVQRRLKHVKEVINMCERKGRYDIAISLREKLTKANIHINNVGLQKMNMLLWNKYNN